MSGGGEVLARWWHRYDEERIQCDLCPRACRLRAGQRGVCFQRVGGRDALFITGYGSTSGMAVDPVEKKPLYHFYPGSSLLSFGTIGCTLACSYCQNWSISQARTLDLLTQEANPERVARAAVAEACRGVAFTYNEPTVFAEYALECARAAHDLGLSAVAVSNGYIQPVARKELFAHLDAVNIDLKAISPDFYREICHGRVDPVLDTLRWLHEESTTWLEVTNLLVPGKNDSKEAVGRLCEWCLENLGPDIPLHFTAFHPAYRMQDSPACGAATLLRARRHAIEAGFHYVYAGNLLAPAAQATYCASCGAMLIRRLGYTIAGGSLTAAGTCGACGAVLPGRFEVGAVA